jgi:hypothetical protein
MNQSLAAKGPTVRRPTYHDGTPALFGPLTKQQLEVIERVGSLLAANRLCRPTRFRPTREEKLAFVQYYHEARHINLETGERYPISLEEAAQKLSVRPELLGKWAATVDEILAMPAGTRRTPRHAKPHEPGGDIGSTDANDYESIGAQADSVVSTDSEADARPEHSTEWTPSLVLSLYYLRKYKLLKVADYHKVRTITATILPFAHEMP